MKPMSVMSKLHEGANEEQTCVLCGKKFTGWGNDAWPLADGYCCDDCNATKVVPARIAQIYGIKNESNLKDDADDASFEQRLKGIFDTVSPEEEYSGYIINNTPIAITTGYTDNVGTYHQGEGVVFYTVGNYLFPTVNSGSLYIQAPNFIKDKSGINYGDSLSFENDLSDEEIKNTFEKLVSSYKQVDPNNRDEKGYSKIIESSNLKEGRFTTDEEDNYPGLDKTIKIYDIDSFVDKEVNEQDAEEQYQPHTMHKAAILIKDDGTGCIVDYEAIGKSFDSTNEEVEISLSPKAKTDENGRKTFSIFPTAVVKVPVKEIMEKAPSSEMKVRDFFRWNYNDRCVSNFNSIKKYITEEGE